MTFTDWLRKKTKKCIDPIAQFIVKIGITANQITFLGFLGNLIASFFISKGQFTVAGIITVFMCPLDVIDGAVARIYKTKSKFGGLLDSVCDRYSEMALLLGLLFHYLEKNFTIGVLVTVFALCGSFLVSYVRARAEGLGVTIKQGILTRVERSIILIISLLLSRPFIGVSTIALLANITAIQRIIIAHKLLIQKEMSETND